MKQRPHNESERQRPALGRNPGFFSELGAYLLVSRKWYLLPVFAALIVLGLLIALGGSAAAPFIYTLF